MTTAPPERIDAGPIVLYRQRPEHAAAIATAVAESLDHLAPWMPWATPANATEAAQADRLPGTLRAWEEGTEYIYVIEHNSTVVGAIGLHRRVGPGAIEVGYWIHAGHTGNGYATAATRAATAAALELDDIVRVELHCDEANLGSAAVARAAGFTLDRIEDDAIEAPGEIGKSMIWIMRDTR